MIKHIADILLHWETILELSSCVVIFVHLASTTIEHIAGIPPRATWGLRRQFVCLTSIKKGSTILFTKLVVWGRVKTLGVLEHYGTDSDISKMIVWLRLYCLWQKKVRAIP